MDLVSKANSGQLWLCILFPQSPVFVCLWTQGTGWRWTKSLLIMCQDEHVRRWHLYSLSWVPKASMKASHNYITGTQRVHQHTPWGGNEESYRIISTDLKAPLRPSQNSKEKVVHGLPFPKICPIQYFTHWLIWSSPGRWTHSSFGKWSSGEWRGKSLLCGSRGSKRKCASATIAGIRLETHDAKFCIIEPRLNFHKKYHHVIGSKKF